MIRIEIYKIVGRSFLKNEYLSSFIQFESCCGVCWCCRRLKKILDEIERKGFNTFNSHIQCWKIYECINNFIYCEWCIEILAERWNEEQWGDMNMAIEKLKKK